MMSVFRDGFGQERDLTGTRVGWRDLERVVSELLDGKALEKKHVFDVLVPSTNPLGTVYGISVKSKCLGRQRNIEMLDEDGRVYMELTNSPAKLWKPLKDMGIDENTFRKETDAERIGISVIKTVHDWYLNSGIDAIDLERSVHLNVSYSDPKKNEERLYQLHSFKLGFPKGIRWAFSSGACLRGYDPSNPGQPLIDWYGLSGGQLKYYPRTSSALYKTPVFTLLKPKVWRIEERSKVYWPSEWEALDD